MGIQHMWSRFPWQQHLGIDLGSCRTRITQNDSGIVLDEPTAVALQPASRKVLAVGRAAEEMQGRVGEHVEVVYPVRGGVIVDADLVESMLRYFLQQIAATSFFSRPVIVASVSGEVQGFHRQMMLDVLTSVGAQEVILVDQLLAAAIGAGVPIADASGSFLVQAGGGVTEVGIISLGSVVVRQRSLFAGEAFDAALEQHLRQETHLAVGKSATRTVKHQLASFLPDRPKQSSVSGQDILELVPKEVRISSRVCAPILATLLADYTQAIRSVLEQVPPELTNDVVDKGILLSGGLSQIDGLELVLMKAVEVPVARVDTPAETVALGLAQIGQHLDLFRQSLGYQQEERIHADIF